MHNGFSCYHKRSGSNNDKSVSAVIRVSERDDGIEINVSRQDQEKSGTSFRTRSSSEITLKNLSEDQVLDIVELLERWLKSESFPTAGIDIDDVEGIHIHEEPGSYRRNSLSTETEFSSIKFSISKQSMKISYWSESANEWNDVSIPSSEVVNNNVPQDISNVGKLYDTLYDFFNFEYSQQISQFEKMDPAKIGRSAVHQIEQIFNRFGEIVIPLQERGGDREPLEMDSESDVQYLLHALLKLYFDDVRREPHTERHSSVSPRIDFLVQNETIGIEVKRASPTRREKTLRKELSEDKEQYRLDTNIDTLLIFVYDPDKQIENKSEFEDSFKQDTPQMITRVTVTR